MAPLQRHLACTPCDTGISTGPLGKQYLDNDGHTNTAGGRPEERHGAQGSWTHGVTILAGGVPRDVRPPTDSINHGTVLYTSATLKADHSGDLRIKPGTADERQGVSGSQAQLRFQTRQHCFNAPQQQLSAGTVLATFPHLKSNLEYGIGKRNVAGGRPDERLGTKGSFTPGVVMCKGGAPCFVPLPTDQTSRGTVLHTSASLRPDNSQIPLVKAGTRGERQGRVGSFQHGPCRLRMPTAADAELWIEAGQNKGGRRFAPGHFLEGVSIFCGGAPTYA